MAPNQITLGVLGQTGQQQVHMALPQAQAPPQGSDHNATISAKALVVVLLPRRGRLRACRVHAALLGRGLC